MDSPKLITAQPASVNMGSEHKATGTTRTICFDLAPDHDSIELTTGEIFSNYPPSGAPWMDVWLMIVQTDAAKESKGLGHATYVEAFRIDD